MNVGERLRNLRELRHLSQGDIEKRTGLLRCYISRVEHGHTVPAIETLEKLARAMEIPLYQLLYDGEGPPKAPDMPKRVKRPENLWGETGKDARTLRNFLKVLSQMSEQDREILLYMAEKMARRSRPTA